VDDLAPVVVLSLWVVVLVGLDHASRPSATRRTIALWTVMMLLAIAGAELVERLSS
jgi:hypothetical protein